MIKFFGLFRENVMSDRGHQLQMSSEPAVDVVAFVVLKAPSTDSSDLCFSPWL